MEKITILIYFTVLSVLVTVNSTIDISSYTYFTGLLHICHNYTRGNLSLCTSDLNDCSRVTIHLNKNEFNSTGNCHVNIYNGTVSDYDTSVHIHNINGSLTTCSRTFSGIMSICDGFCNPINVNGSLYLDDTNPICSLVATHGIIDS